MRKTERFLLFGGWLFVVLMSLSLTPILQHRLEAGRFPNGLSKEYREFTIGYHRERIDSQGIVFPDLAGRLQARGKPFAILRKKSANCFSCVLWNQELSLPVFRGRSFSQEDMERGANVAMVSGRVEKQIFEERGVPSIELDGHIFEVIGVFEAEDNLVNPQPDFVVSGLSEHEMMRMPYVDGIYFLDTVGVEDVLTDLDQWCGIVTRKTPYQKTSDEKWEDAKSVTFLSVGLSTIVCVFSVMAFGVVLVLWLRKLRRELRVRRLCGADRVDICRWLSGRFGCSVMLATLAAMPVVLLFHLSWMAECIVLGGIMLFYGLVCLAAMLLVNLIEME